MLVPKPLAFLGVPFDGAATLGWPGARYAPDEGRRNLDWMKMRVEDGHIYSRWRWPPVSDAQGVGGTRQVSSSASHSRIFQAPW